MMPDPDDAAALESITESVRDVLCSPVLTRREKWSVRLGVLVALMPYQDAIKQRTRESLTPTTPDRGA